VVARSDDDFSQPLSTQPAGRGVLRRLDELGRVVIPAPFRKVLGIRLGDPLDLTLEGDALVLRPLRRACALCDGVVALQPFREVLVCAMCREQLARP
jgi:AbrB family transcriptional regulator, transcriptional pleiotropic regulator of transition state genes